tara:strand:- start:645 stop:3107 length:2463 start_codon:yes stop_codon:yes gene_type:complete
MEGAAPAAGDGLTQASTREETTHMPPTTKAIDHNHVEGHTEGDTEGDAGGPTDTIGSSDKNSPMNSASQKPSGTDPLNNVSGETSILATATTTSGSSQHLEAYYLRPHIETNNDFAKMLYRIEHLLLSEDGIRAHIKQLGPDYSIIFAIAKLPPQQLGLIQEYTKIRKGQLIAVHFGEEVDIVMPMGTFKSKSVFFVLQVDHREAMSVQESTTETTKSAPVKETATQGSALPFDTSVSKTSAATFTAPSCPLPPTYVSPAAQLPDWVRKVYDSGFRDEQEYPAGIARYMSIPFAFCNHPRQFQSFEELRLTDYTAGRKVPFVIKKTNHFLDVDASHTQAGSSATPTTGGLFGAPAMGGGFFASHNQQPGQNSSVFGGTASTSFFGGSAPSKTTNNPGGGLFGQIPVPGNLTSKSSPQAWADFGKRLELPDPNLRGLTSIPKNSSSNNVKTNTGGLYAQATPPASNSGPSGLLQNKSTSDTSGTAPTHQSEGRLFGSTPAAASVGASGGSNADANSARATKVPTENLSGATPTASTPSSGIFDSVDGPTSPNVSGSHDTSSIFASGILGSNTPPTNPFAALRIPAVCFEARPRLFPNITRPASPAAPSPPSTCVFGKLNIAADQPGSATKDDTNEANCWLCDGKPHKDTPTSIPSHPAPFPTALQTPVPAPEPPIPSTNTPAHRAAARKARTKAVDFDPSHETEAKWSARYERVEARRIDDENAVPAKVFVVTPQGMAIVREKEQTGETGAEESSITPPGFAASDIGFAGFDRGKNGEGGKKEGGRFGIDFDFTRTGGLGGKNGEGMGGTARVDGADQGAE